MVFWAIPLSATLWGCQWFHCPLWERGWIGPEKVRPRQREKQKWEISSSLKRGSLAPDFSYSWVSAASLLPSWGSHSIIPLIIWEILVFIWTRSLYAWCKPVWIVFLSFTTEKKNSYFLFTGKWFSEFFLKTDDAIQKHSNSYTGVWWHELRLLQQCTEVCLPAKAMTLVVPLRSSHLVGIKRLRLQRSCKCIYIILYWSKSSSGFVHKMIWKNPNELFG